MSIPHEHRTARLLLRPWRADDAELLLPVLETNRDHLAAWIPQHVASPLPLPELRQRLTTFAADFTSAREWRYALFSPDGAQVYGEVSLFPRGPGGRTTLERADRVEIGYWLAAECTGRGFATEAAQAALAIAATVPRFGHAEIRCDARNAPSAAVPHRLGFHLERPAQDPAGQSSESAGKRQLWRYDLRKVRQASDPGAR
jgi:ribosomal-protein-serine acetyltransferase